MATISERLHLAVKTSTFRQYKLARAIGVHHSTLSCWLNGISDVQFGDRRVLDLGAILGVPETECFEESITPSKQGNSLRVEQMKG